MMAWCGINGVYKDVRECKLNAALCECGRQRTPPPAPTAAEQAQPVGAGIFSTMNACMFRDECRKRAAMLSVAPVPEQAQPAGVTDEQIEAAFLATIPAHPGELSLTQLPAIKTLVRYVMAARAQEGEKP